MFSNLTQSVGIPLNGIIINLGSSAVVEWASFSSSSRLCVTSQILRQFSPATWSLVHSSCRKHNSVKRCSSSCCCSCFASNCFISIFLYISSCLLFKNFASFSFSTRNNGIPGLHVLLPLSHLLSRYIMIYFHFLCL